MSANPHRTIKPDCRFPQNGKWVCSTSLILISQIENKLTNMATLVRSASKLRCNLNRLGYWHKTAVTQSIAQPTCAIFTSNKKKDSAAIPVAEKQEKEMETVDNLLEKEEVDYTVPRKNFTDSLTLIAQNFALFHLDN